MGNLLPPHYKHIPLGKLARLGHLVAVIEMRGVLVAAIRPEGKFQSGLFGQLDEVFVGDVGHLVDLDGDLFAGSLGRVRAQAEDAVDPRAGPEFVILARDRDREKRGPGEDVDGFGGQHLLDELHVARHEGFGVVDVGVDLPNRQRGAVGVGQGERVHQDVVELVEQGLRETFWPSGEHGLQADADGIGAQPVDVLLEVGVGVDGVSGAGVLDDADLDSAVFAELEGLVDCERGAQVDVIVGDREPGLRWRGGRRFRGSDVKIPTSGKTGQKWGTRFRRTGERGCGYG